MNATKSTKSVPVHFPTGCDHAVTGNWIAGWKRTYPTTMTMDEHDHLAVASGAYSRYCEDPGRFERTASGTWVEDLSAVYFDDVDVAYLDWLSGGQGGPRFAGVSRWIQAYRVGAGKARFRGEILASADDRRVVGWMYATLGTFLYWQERKDSFAVNSESGLFGGREPWATDEDDGWATGRTWGSDNPDWIPARHDAFHLVGQILRRKTATCEKAPAGSFARVSLLLVKREDETTAIELPGRWAPSPAPVGEFQWDTDGGRYRPGVEFVDRHIWDALLWASDELRTLYSRIVERGPLCPTPADPTDRYDRMLEGVGLPTDPIQWVYETVENVMSHVPAYDPRDVKVAAFLTCVREMANACLDMADRIPEEDQLTINWDRFAELVDAEFDTHRHSTMVRVTRRGDVAMCEPVY